jgi:cereblon
MTEEHIHERENEDERADDSEFNEDEENEEYGDDGDYDMEDHEPGLGILNLLDYLLSQEEPEDTNPINFDTSLPSTHQYLGDVDLVPLKDIGDLTHGVEITIPLFSFPHVVLFPGESLPLVFANMPQAEALQELLNNGDRLIGVANSHFKSEVITVAEIRYRKTNADGRDDVLIAVGKHRLLMKRVRQVDGKLFATGHIFEDAPTRIPPEAKKNMTFWPPAMWKIYDSRLLMKQARKLACLIEAGINERTENMHPTQYSFWLARNMPLQDSLRHALLEKPSTQERLTMEISLLKQFSEIKCNNCGSTLSSADQMLNMSTEGTLGAYANAHGYIHETVTVKRVGRARVIMDGSPPSTEQSWFPGYAWTIIYCTGCYQHVGWKYTAVASTTHPQVFWGLRRAALRPV